MERKSGIFLPGFDQLLRETLFKPGILEFEHDPDKIVHMRGGTDLKSSQELYRRGKALFSTLRDSYGISVPPFEYIFGQNPSEKNQSSFTIYTVRDRVAGIDLVKADASEETGLRDKVDNFFTKFVHFYSDVYDHGGDYLTDVPPAQFVYGKCSQDTEKEVYFVDTDPWLNNYDKQNEESPFNHDFFYTLKFLFETLQYIKHSLKIHLPRADQSFKDLIQSLQSRKYGQPEIDELKRAAINSNQTPLG